MCYSILVVSYEAEKNKAQVKCDSEADERAKVKDICEKDMPAKIEVFRCQRIVRRERVWNELPYAPPETATA
jgi:hypothetical protein